MKKRADSSRILLMLCIGGAMLLSGCAINRSFTPEVHKVNRGESLSIIAAHYGLNWRELARWNGIRPPYTIYVGERLSLDPFPPLNYDQMRKRRQAAVTKRHPTPRSTVTTIDDDRGFTVSKLPTSQRKSTDRNAGSTASTRPDTPQPVVATNSDGNRNVPAQTSPLVNKSGWRWPLADAILDPSTMESARHGINIYGVEGTPIYAARAGQVVYSGAGLQGIGELVIIKHDNEYLSAYGYAANLQVEEGDRIAAGQHIADMGVGPGTRAELHFEIRHEGEPINPKSVLPNL